jgi:phosphoglycerate dehydrogenase-like enzyme
MALNILVTMAFPDELLEQIRSVSSEISLSYAPLKKDESLPKSTVAMAEVLYTWSALPRPEEAPNLKWVQFHSAGIDHVQGQPLLDCDLLVTTTSGIHAIPIGEYVMATILAWSHRVPRMLVYQTRGIWPGGRWEKFVPQELRSATIGIVGYGSIGREVARLAHAFGMRILATKRDPRHVEDTGYRIEGTGDPSGELPARIYPSAATRSMLPECDYVVVSAPLTPETVHLVDRAALKAMKPTAYLVNIARGELVDQVALIEALQKGWIAGAGLDVFEPEPLPPDSPLWKMDNVILSPHVAGFTPEYDRRAIDLFTANLRRYLEGQKLINTVDCRRGY